MWAICCCPRAYTFKQFQNNSGFVELGRVDTSNGIRSLNLAGSKLFLNYFSTHPSAWLRGSRYSNALAFEQNIDHSYDGSLLIGNSNLVVALSASRTAGVNRLAVAEIGSAGSLAWETELDFGIILTNSIAIDSSDQVYVSTYEGGGNATLYLFNSSGGKVWRVTSISTVGTSSLCVVDSAGYAWVAAQAGADVKLARVNTSGTVVQTVTISNRYLNSIRNDGSTGIWVHHSSSPFSIGDKFERFDSSGSSVASWTDTDVFAAPFAVDGSNNLYSLIRVSSVNKVRKYNSGGTTQWTSGDIGFGNGLSLSDIAADSSYVYVSASASLSS